MQYQQGLQLQARWSFEDGVVGFMVLVQGSVREASTRYPRPRTGAGGGYRWPSIAHTDEQLAGLEISPPPARTDALVLIF
jgi:hypothetical protein